MEQQIAIETSFGGNIRDTTPLLSREHQFNESVGIIRVSTRMLIQQNFFLK